VFVVDTNILLYAANGDAPEHAVCHGLVQRWREEATPWYVTWGIVYEFLRVATHPRGWPQPFPMGAAWRFIEAVLAPSHVGVLIETDRHERVAAEVLRTTAGLSGNLLFDAHTAILMKEHGLRTLYTRDVDFHRFPFIEVVDPIQGTRRGAVRESRRGYGARARR
jgi:uncharacterized protein